MSKIFFTSDLHFGHKNIIKFDNRPFFDVSDMNKELIKRWNNKVTKDDVVYVCGDFIWKRRLIISKYYYQNSKKLRKKARNPHFVCTLVAGHVSPYLTKS